MERIVIEPPTVAELTEYAEGLLDAYGIRLRRDARQLLSESIGVLCGNRYFDGYKSVKMLCEDIAYALYAEGFDKRGVRAADVERYAADGEYVQRMVVTIEKTHTIGF
jgi:hypothetical protein